MDLVRLPKTTLRQSSKRVTTFDEQLRSTISDMGSTMLAEDGIGLAAPQIGLNIRVIVVRNGESNEYRSFINPEITYNSSKTVSIEEGCLSIPGVYGYVERSAKIRISYQDDQGRKKIMKASGMDAIVLQHEIDHINGVLIIDRSISITKGHDDFERFKSGAEGS